jgi:hypothetical protein
VITTLAVENYRSLRHLVMPMRRLNVVTGANGTGQSSVYRALRLLADAARNGAVAALAREGGLPSTLWAGPEHLGRSVRRGEHPTQGTVRTGPASLKLGFAGDDFGYAIDFGMPVATVGKGRRAPPPSTSTRRSSASACGAGRCSGRRCCSRIEVARRCGSEVTTATGRSCTTRCGRTTACSARRPTRPLVSALQERARDLATIELVKDFGQTQLLGHGRLDEPPWHWPKR